VTASDRHLRAAGFALVPVLILPLLLFVPVLNFVVFSLLQGLLAILFALGLPVGRSTENFIRPNTFGYIAAGALGRVLWPAVRFPEVRG
jgi:hypothetical protein